VIFPMCDRADISSEPILRRLVRTHSKVDGKWKESARKGKSMAKRRESEETRKNRPQGWANNGSNKDK